MLRRTTALPLLCAAAALAGAAVAAPAFAGGTVSRVSVDYQTAGDANNTSTREAISPDGGYVCWESNATDLVPNEYHTHVWDIFWADLATGQIKRVSVDATTGGDDNGSSHYCAISDDGTYVVFSSNATDLVAGMTTGGNQVFERDMATGVTTLVSWNDKGTKAGNGMSERATVSADGRYVAFNSQATDLVPGDTHPGDVYVRDMVLGVTKDLSLTPTGGPANGTSLHPVISADGTHVAYESTATDLVPGDTSTNAQILETTVATGATVLVSQDDQSGGSDNNRNTRPSISATGQFVAWESPATDLVTTPVPGKGVTEIYERDTVNDITSLVSVDADGAPLQASSSRASVDGAGDLVAYDSTARGVVAHLWGVSGRQVYLRDMTTGVNSLVSESTSGSGGGCPEAAARSGKSPYARSAPAGVATRPSVDSAGDVIAFLSNYCNLVAPQTVSTHMDLYAWTAG